VTNVSEQTNGAVVYICHKVHGLAYLAIVVKHLKVSNRLRTHFHTFVTHYALRIHSQNKVIINAASILITDLFRNLVVVWNVSYSFMTRMANVIFNHIARAKICPLQEYTLFSFNYSDLVSLK
jgi:hypothetical protein